jgi:hypothetical protein
LPIRYLLDRQTGGSGVLTRDLRHDAVMGEVTRRVADARDEAEDEAEDDADDE